MQELIIDRMRAAAGDLWDRAVTHPSGGSEHNRRLEFLGSGVLKLALADLMYRRSEEREGKLPAVCDYLSSDDVLNEAGRRIGLGSILKFEMSTYRMPSDAIVVSGVRAVVGAVHEKAGYDAARGFVEELLLTDELLKRAMEPDDPIAELNEWLEGSPQRPKVMAYDEIVDGKKVFYHSMELFDQSVIGVGHSMRRAEAHAARLMMSLLSAPA